MVTGLKLILVFVGELLFVMFSGVCCVTHAAVLVGSISGSLWSCTITNCIYILFSFFVFDHADVWLDKLKSFFFKFVFFPLLCLREMVKVIGKRLLLVLVMRESR